MAKKAEQGQAAPTVVPGYGEMDDEAESMSKAAHEDETHSGASEAGGQSALDAAKKIVPETAGPVGYGTTETDVKKSIAETASRKASKPAGAL